MSGQKGIHPRIIRCSKGDDQYFFGYYDLFAFSRDGQYHLCNRVKFWDRLPQANDLAELGMVDLSNGRFNALAETTAWNFQQGAMLQWHPLHNNEIIFNERVDNEFQGVVMNIQDGRKHFLSRPVANVDPTGRYGLSINFERLYDFRAGYGYAGKGDRFKKVDHPAEDGIFLVDMNNGESRMVISLQQIWELSRDNPLLADKKLVVNHLTFNTDGTRFVFLARYFPTTPGGEWGTAIYTANRDGTDIYRLLDYSYASHYHWRDPEHVLFHARNFLGDQLYLFTDQASTVEAIDPQFFLRDGHCSYSPDRNWLLYDSYPDQDGYRELYLYDLHRKSGITLGKLEAIPPFPNPLMDLRCDLHPRWNPNGAGFSFDSIHEGQRHLYYMDLSEIISNGF